MVPKCDQYLNTFYGLWHPIQGALSLISVILPGWVLFIFKSLFKGKTSASFCHYLQLDIAGRREVMWPFNSSERILFPSKNVVALLGFTPGWDQITKWARPPPDVADRIYRHMFISLDVHSQKHWAWCVVTNCGFDLGKVWQKCKEFKVHDCNRSVWSSAGLPGIWVEVDGPPVRTAPPCGRQQPSLLLA